jgi:23S rRNA pseudouridine2605 synthase
MKTSRGPGRVSLPRAISKLGFASRAEATRLIQSGEVMVNRKVELNPHRWIDLVHDRIEIKSRKLVRQAFRYIVLHKPRGFVTTKVDELGQRTVFELLDNLGEGLTPVGRLDMESTGLLVFTNDHQLANRLTSPESGILKSYVVTLDKPIDEKDMHRLSRGVEIEIKGITIRTKPALVSRRRPAEIQISISEGKNRQIRRMLSEIGYGVTALQRISIGPLQVGDLREGQWRELSLEEVRALKEAARSPEAKAPARKNGRRFSRRH